MTFYGPRKRSCLNPKCGVAYFGLEDRCPKCGYSPSNKPVPREHLGDVTVSMQDPGVYESDEPMDFKDGGYPQEDVPKGGVKE